jgi:hypothetical protein
VCGSSSFICVADEKQVGVFERDSFRIIKSFKVQIFSICYDSCLKQFLLGGRGKHRYYIDADEDIEI